VLRSLKNRFGSTDEIGIFEMDEKGLKEIDNPLAFLENQQTELVSGKAIVGVAEGKRPLFFEIQTLTVPTTLNFPRRIVNGVDYNKALLLLAVIRKHLNISLDSLDVYINVVGGVQVKSPAVDLGIVAALLSSLSNQAVPKKTVFFGEVGLLGEVRTVSFQDKIGQEATRLKFNTIISSKNLKNIKDLKRILFPR
ncbi:MAG: DNA repair protein RadA, partial [Microgenomates group bacterium]